jgi:Caudovirus prohead serine protease
MNPLKFILNNESIKNSYGFRVLSQGISLERFEANPVMLDGHYMDNSAVIGSWSDLILEDGQLSAVANFIENDSKVQSIKNKVEQGHLRGVSMGISFRSEDMQLIGGELILTQCELYEASIVAVPSNAAAVRLYQNGQLMGKTQLQKLCLSLSQNTIIPTQNPSEDQSKKNNKMLKLSQLAFIALAFSPTTTEASEAEINAAILSLEVAKDKAQKALTEAQAEIKRYQDLALETQDKNAQNLIAEAVKAGQISGEQKEAFLQLAKTNLELAQNIINNLPTKNSYTAGLTAPTGKHGINSIDDFHKLSHEQQINFRDSYPEAYNALFS